MSGGHGSAIIAADITAAVAAGISAVGAFHDFQFHEAVGTTAGLMAIAYYLYQFSVWVWRHWNNNDGD